MKLSSLFAGVNPEPMTDQDLADWGNAVDAKSSVSGRPGVTRENTINAGQAAADVINARRGKT